MNKEHVLDVITEVTSYDHAISKLGILVDLCMENTKENRRELTNILKELKKEGKIDTYYMTYDEGRKFCGRGYTLAE